MYRPYIKRIVMSDRAKPLWTIVMPDGTNYGQRKDGHGFQRFQAWSRKKDAERVLRLLVKDTPMETFLPGGRRA